MTISFRKYLLQFVDNTNNNGKAGLVIKEKLFDDFPENFVMIDHLRLYIKKNIKNGVIDQDNEPIFLECFREYKKNIQI